MEHPNACLRVRVLRAWTGLLVSGIVLVAWSSAVHTADGWPSRPVRLIVPFPPGGANDIVARLVAGRLQERWGTPVVIDNRAGAGGNIGTELGARANPDGYTLLVGSGSTLGSNASLYAKLPFDVLKDFAPISLIAAAPFVLVAHPSLPARTLPELVALAKASPGRITYSSFGEGSSAHLVGELFQSLAGVKMIHVPYKGGSPAMTAVVGGEVQATVANLSVALPYIRGGKVNAIGVTTARRAAALPEAPTIAEAGLPGFEASAWVGLVAPVGTRPAMVQRFNADTHAAVQHPDTQKQLEVRGLEPMLSTPAEFARYLAEEVKRWDGVVRSAGIRRL
ncbi:MAG: tripartite tricarboxylate transporter substrate binding protein [Rhodocyclaceae bacterium]|jgi:tripartite-type tricarboxylate transporter receptor subunit TctC|nr:tripartite tricarboxylate transporter substrate binding protein [Rhodocyclaceae bacterium]MCE2980440.1 tripartite tricarboxylate transporter substrate binding protein [Betaproteobacteria bacterium]MCA3074158.1 tripartite tricarboxylate transporter substrate binding protein [Rhodocyclaceae bacterium]MCA3092209.1 tripartite tricarboxylate transporter substrate binding protein [Rhodocyclaceae bacterium]MCA3092365.1 tripartite tricarboxylate transporter substrate binding protein [Rhodocyclaceae 